MATKKSKSKAKLPKPVATPEPGHLPKEEDEFNGLEEFFPFKPQHITALQEYQKDLDIDRACKAAGLSAYQKKCLLDPTTSQGLAFLKECKNIQEQYTKAIELNANSSAVKHIELMRKFEQDYDRTDIKSQNKSGLASTLARMSDTSLKATGQFTKEGTGGGTKVEINIDLSSNAKSEEELPPIDVEVTKDE